MTTQIIPFEYTMKAIETEYKGCLFRSRLEAKWAAFFDFVGIGWEYEPFDVDGWMPDFLIKWPAVRRGMILAEVKPITEFNEHTAQKIDNSGWNGKAFMLGAAFFVDSPWLCMGWSRISSNDIKDDIVYITISDEWAWDSLGITNDPSRYNIYENYWKRAGNAVRWKK